MDIADLPPLEMRRLAHHRYHTHLTVLHAVVAAGASPSVGLMETLEQARQVLEMADERVLAACGLAPDEDQLALPLECAPVDTCGDCAVNNCDHTTNEGYAT